MATESERSQRAIRLPPDLEAWLEELAEEHGLDRERLLERLLEANRHALEDGDADRTERVESLEAELDEKIDDVRARMLQLKRQTESKASAEHDHEEFDRFDDLEEQLMQAESAVSELETDIEELATAAEANEETLETTRERLRRVATVVVRLRQQMHGDEDDHLQKLRQIAAQRGFETANCRACGNAVNISLLSEPICPHCSAQFGDIAGDDSFFSTPKLVGGSDDQ